MLIGIVGFAGSGKDTIGNILVSEFNFAKISFASKVKDIVAVKYNWPRHLLEGDTIESRIFRETPDPYWSKIFSIEFTPRHALIFEGTNLVRDVQHKDFWIFSLFNVIDLKENNVVTDVRFLNEIEEIKKNNGIIIRVKRNVDPTWFNTLKDIEDSNRERLYNQIGLVVSELDWIRKNAWQYEIENDSDLISLKESVRMLMNNIIRRSK